MSDKAKNKWILFVVVAFVGFILDILTKYAVSSNMRPGESIPLIGNLLEIFFVYNKGAVFGLDPRRLIAGFPVNAFFYVFSSLAVLLLIFYYRSIDQANRLLRWGVSLIMPGALGNLYDRIVHPQLGVVDFIKVDIGFWPFNPWPIFNLADMYITIGVILVLIEFVREENRKKSVQQESGSSPSQTHET